MTTDAELRRCACPCGCVNRVSISARCVICAPGHPSEPTVCAACGRSGDLFRECDGMQVTIPGVHDRTTREYRGCWGSPCRGRYLCGPCGAELGLWEADKDEQEVLT